MTAGAAAEAVAWHDVECGDYAADLDLWRELADAEGSPVVDVGAGTGRVALDLAARGHDVTAVDLAPALLDALRTRAAAAGLTVAVVEGDARKGLGVDPGSARLVLAPMQFVQILGGGRGRAAFLRAARTALAPGGLLAMAIAGELDAFAPGDGPLPPPDVLRRDGARYVSQPTAIVVESCVTKIQRSRRIERPDARARTSRDVIALDHITGADLMREGAAAGLVPEPLREIASTDEHVGSVVVVLRRPE